MASGHELDAGAGPSASARDLPSDHLVARNLRDIRARIDAAAVSAGRAPDDVTLIAVSKTFGVDRVRAAASAGQIDFGENRVQEGLGKCAEASDLDLRWHLVGHLQTNKVRKVVEPFTWIHSVDSVELLQRLEHAAAEHACRPSLLIQVDLAGETTKHGATVSTLPTIFDAAATCRAVRVRGLMLLPPFDEDPERVRPHFRRLRDVRDGLRHDGVDPAMLEHLSMGMSHDFEVAVQEGATLVRVGSAIFGRRPAPVPSV